MNEGERPDKGRFEELAPVESVGDAATSERLDDQLSMQ